MKPKPCVQAHAFVEQPLPHASAVNAGADITRDRTAKVGVYLSRPALQTIMFMYDVVDGIRVPDIRRYLIKK